MLDDTGASIDRRALDVMIDDALAPEVMVGERVDTILLSSHVFGLDEAGLADSTTFTGAPGLLAFTERRMIAAHSVGIVRVRRSVEAFVLDGSTRFNAVTPMVSGRPVRLFEVANGQGWHRVFLPDPTQVASDVVNAWDKYVAARLVGALIPTWDGSVFTGWDKGNPTVPTRRPPEALDPSGPLPTVDLSGESRWWRD